MSIISAILTQRFSTCAKPKARMNLDLLYENPVAPKRGDLVHTNVGDRKRERTWFVLHARRVRRRPGLPPRYKLFLARWWSLEVETREALFRSAERRGGQYVHYAQPNPKKKKKVTFGDTLGSYF